MSDKVVTDSRGRRIMLRKVGVLETLRLYKALGPELSVNGAYMAAASIAAAAAMIDDVPMPFPNNEAGVELLLERLGDEGVMAVVEVSTEPPLETKVSEAGN
ncbi:MAG: hypothetical protein P4L54_02330 [Acidocella sp.]|nr:hypothetical protein [Acidocella sp.]